MELGFEGFAVLVGIPVLILGLVLAWLRKRSFSYLFCMLVFGVYLLFVIKWTLLPLPLDPGMGEVLRAQGVGLEQRMNLRPFYFGPFATPESILFLGVPNVLLTMPLGFWMPFVAPVRGRHLPGLVLLGGLGIEAAQLLVGWLIDNPYRVIDVNDAILNAAGVLVGYVLFRGFAWLYAAVVQGFGGKPRGFFAYLYEISTRV